MTCDLACTLMETEPLDCDEKREKGECVLTCDKACMANDVNGYALGYCPHGNDPCKMRLETAVGIMGEKFIVELAQWFRAAEMQHPVHADTLQESIDAIRSEVDEIQDVLDAIVAGRDSDGCFDDWRKCETMDVIVTAYRSYHSKFMECEK